MSRQSQRAQSEKHTIWVKVSDDPFEYIEEMADTRAQLARKLNIDVNTINKALWRAHKFGARCLYKCIEIDDSEAEE